MEYVGVLTAVVLEEVLTLITSLVDAVDGFVVFSATTLAHHPELMEHPTVNITVAPRSTGLPRRASMLSLRDVVDGVVAGFEENTVPVGAARVIVP